MGVEMTRRMCKKPEMAAEKEVVGGHRNEEPG
jgi:hypothetical protein